MDRLPTVGIVCEYDPFHNGHLRQLGLIRAAFGSSARIVCAMSGCFLQRGEPAMFDPSVRAHAAALCGANLVVALPVHYSLRSAEGFADGAVSVLSRLGCNVICFGTESASAERCMEAARLLLSSDFAQALREELTAYDSFAAARERALRRLMTDPPVSLPNDILGVEYCKALLRRNCTMQPFVVRREGAYHADAADPSAPSASFLRKQLRNGGDVRQSIPSAAAELFANAAQHSLQSGERAVLAFLRTLPDCAFEALPYGAEGLWRKLMRSCREAPDLASILDAAKSKRYARTRLQRMVICACLGIDQSLMQSDAPYYRVLAFGQVGAGLIREARAAGAPLLDGGVAPPISPYAALETRAEDLYALFSTDAPFACGMARKRRNVVLKEC